MASIHIEAKGSLVEQGKRFDRGDAPSDNHTRANTSLTSTASWQSTSVDWGTGFEYVIVANLGSEAVEVSFSAASPTGGVPIVLSGTQRVLYPSTEAQTQTLWYRHIT